MQTPAVRATAPQAVRSWVLQTIMNANARSIVNIITRSLQVIPAATENLLAHLLQVLTRILKRPTITESNQYSISTTALKTGDARISFPCPNLSLGKEKATGYDMALSFNQSRA